MFWEDLPVASGKRERVIGPPPAIPETGWRPPAEFPNLSAAKAIAFDVETYDPELQKNGPGWARGSGHIVGFSVAVEGGAWYFPIRHETETELNLDSGAALAWLDHTLSGPQPKIGANLMYDYGWCQQEGVQVGGPLYDIQFAEALLNSEAPDVSLEALSWSYLGLGKETNLLYQWLADWMGGDPTPQQRKHIHRAPPSLVGPYGEADAHLPLQIIRRQWPLLEQRNVLGLFSIECRLIPLLVAMRFRGAPVNVGKAEKLYDTLTKQIKAVEKQAAGLVGFTVNPYASSSLKQAFDHLGLPYPVTAAGNPSFTAEVLDSIDHPLARMILEQKQLTKTRDVFVKSYILESSVNGKIHCQFHPLKSDAHGTRSGRFSSSTPNLQNIPVRTKLGKQVREVFEDHTDGRRWRKFDYDQIEYRLFAHHAEGPGSQEIKYRYQQDPKTDYHEETIRLLREIAGIEVARRPAKTINFGLIYGMGKKELTKRIGDSGDAIYGAYHTALPFVKTTMEAASRFAQQHGYITTCLGRRSDFPLWGPASFEAERLALQFDEALMRFGGSIQRAFTHKALNRRLQGGAADIMKVAMVMCYEAGVFDETGIPLITVHDELDFTENDPASPAWTELVNIMETCVGNAVTVPIKVSESVGANWGEAD